MKICITCDGVAEDDQAQCAHCGTRLLAPAEVHFPLRRGEDVVGSPHLGRLVAGKYRLVGVLGRGGMATVYRAVHAVSLIAVALKLMHPRFAVHSEYREWFVGEARKAGQVVHEHVARVQDVGIAEDGAVYLAIELVDGVTVEDWVRQEGGLPPELCIALLEQIARALAAAHAAGVVHRDLSPRNVMVVVRDQQPVVKVLDFGIATSVAMRPDRGRSAGIVTAGRSPFSAPEVRAGREVDGRADLYSVGALACFALTGSPPPVDDAGERMRFGRRVPRGLQRLLRELLAPDPEARPPSAGEVAARLRRLAGAPGRVLRPVSIVALLVAAVAVAVSYSPRLEPFLVDATGALRLSARADPLSAPLEIRSEVLREVVLECGGLGVSRLWCDVSSVGGTVALPLAVRAGADGVLRIDRADERWRQLVAEVVERSAQSAVQLQFRLGGDVLACARLRIDDVAPRLTIDWTPATEQANGQTVARLDVEDGGTLRSCEVIVQAGTAPQRRLAVAPLRSGPRTLKADTVFAGVATDAAERRGVRVWVEAEDAAGNLATTPPVPFDAVDLRTPRIVNVASPAGTDTLTYDSDGAELRVQVDEAEPGLRVWVRDPSELSTEYLPRLVGQTLELRLQPTRGEVGFLEGVYAIWLTDRAGNESAVLRRELTFRSRALDPRLVPAAGDARGGVTVRGGRIVCDGEPLRLLFTCNSLFRPRSAELVGPGSQVSALELRDGVAGAATVLVPELPAGEYGVRVVVEDEVRDVLMSTGEFEITALPSPPALSLPDFREARFLREQLDQSLWRWDGRAIVPGAGWRLQPDRLELLSGRIVIGTGDELAEPAVFPVGPSAWLAPFEPRRGQTVVAAAVTDVLGRAIEVDYDGRPAETIAGPAGEPVVVLTRFEHHDDPFRAVEPELLLELDQPASLTLRSELRFDAADDVSVSLGSASMPAQQLLAERGGCRLVFRLPFEAVRDAAGLGDAGELAFREGRESSLWVRVFCPAGDFRIRLDVRTIQSSLDRVALGAVARAALPPELAAIELVPVLRPGRESPWADPVAGDLEARWLFRPYPPVDVRNLEDVFLQAAELTRAQYRAVVRLLPELVAGVGDDWGAIVHAGDPLGRARLSAAGMLPVRWVERGAEFESLRGRDAEAPVTGVDYFQAHAFVRLLGVAAAGDPELLRLPSGTELEHAALAAAPGALNASASMRSDVFRGAASERLGFGTAPPPAVEAAELGDAVATELGERLIGLDFGAREWVIDLPYADDEFGDLLRAWHGNHAELLQRAAELASGGRGGIPAALRTRLLRLGVVRGTPTGSPYGLVDVLAGTTLAGDGPVTPGVPGVTRILQPRRDGRAAVGGGPDPHLATIGFRVAGGQRFVREVRQQ